MFSIGSASLEATPAAKPLQLSLLLLLNHLAQPSLLLLLNHLVQPSLPSQPSPPETALRNGANVVGKATQGQLAASLARLAPSQTIGIRNVFRS